MTTPTMEPAQAATGEGPEVVDRAASQPAGRSPLAELLPQINELAEKVGGYKQLARIVEILSETKE
jgi:hypothetical protein